MHIPQGIPSSGGQQEGQDFATNLEKLQAAEAAGIGLGRGKIDQNIHQCQAGGNSGRKWWSWPWKVFKEWGLNSRR